MTQPLRTVIVCDNYQRFRIWCLDQNINPRNPNYVYVGPHNYEIRKLQGLDRFRLIILEESEIHPDVDRYIQHLRTLGRIDESPVD